jgi:hypothetical protein
MFDKSLSLKMVFNFFNCYNSSQLDMIGLVTMFGLLDCKGLGSIGSNTAWLSVAYW